MVTNRRYALHAPAKSIGFIGIVSFHQNDDGHNFTVDQDFTFVTESGLAIRVPKGFVTDLASVPRVFWAILPCFGTYTDGAVVHDMLYHHNGVVLFKEDGRVALNRVTLTRKECDDVLLEAMRDCHTPRWQQVVIYRAVRWFGGMAWRQDARMSR